MNSVAFLEVPCLIMICLNIFVPFSFCFYDFWCCVFMGFLCVFLYLYVFRVLFIWFFCCFTLFDFVGFYFYLYCLKKRSAEPHSCTPALWHHFNRIAFMRALAFVTSGVEQNNIRIKLNALKRMC